MWRNRDLRLEVNVINEENDTFLWH
jgi:hypothetical protein